MQRFFAVLPASLVVAASLVLAADDKPGELAGAWQLVSSNGQRQETADDPDKSTLLTFNAADGTWNLQGRSDSDGLNISGTYVADATQTPKTLDSVINGDGGASSINAIYKIEGDVLTVHFRQDGIRPGDFDGPPETSSTLVFKKHKTE